jgi:hypothetical protein
MAYEGFFILCMRKRWTGRHRSTSTWNTYATQSVTVILNNAGLRKRPAALASNGRDGVNQWMKLGNIVTVGAREDHRERDALRFGDEVVL